MTNEAGDSIQVKSPRASINMADCMGEKDVEAQGSSDQTGATDPSPHVHFTTFMALFAICLIYFSQTFMLVGTGAQGHTIVAYFNHPGDSVWPTACLTIPSVVLGPIVSQTADFWGRKPFLVASSLFGLAGSIVAARATSFAMLLAGLTVTGLEFGALPLLHTVPSEILPRKWRAPAQAAVMVANSFGLILGLVLGGVFGRREAMDGFRDYYYISTGLFALAMVVVLVAYQPPLTPLQSSLSLREKLGDLDWIGFGLLASSVVLFCVGLAWSRNPYHWSDAHVSAPFAIGAGLVTALVVYETAFKRDGLFHHGLFKGTDWNFALALLAVFCEGCAFFAATVYYPFQIQLLYESDPLRGAGRFSIAFVATIPAAIVTGLYCTITKRVRWITVLSFLIFVAFFASMATTNRGSNTQVWGYPVLLGCALGMTLVTLVTVAQLSTPPELIAVASGLIISIRSLGGSIGIAIYNAVFVDETEKLFTNVAKAAVAAGLPPSSVEGFVGSVLAGNETAAAQIPGVTPTILGSGVNAMLDTFVKAFEHVWITAAAFVGFAAVATIFLKDPTKEFNNHIDAPVEREEKLFGER